jgi:hypothetical protein
MKKMINMLFLGFSVLIVLMIGAILLTNKPLPEGTAGPAAEALTDQMLEAINGDAWNDTRYIGWTFRNSHHYIWDKRYNLADIQYHDTRVLLNLNTLEGIVWNDQVKLAGKEKTDPLAKAWESWCNHSYWLNPIVKIRDEGTERKLVKLDDNRNALLVTYTKGGITPGDSYLWIPDSKGLPSTGHMWVKILPMKGLKSSLGDWIELPGGAKIPLSRKIGFVDIRISNVRSGSHHSDLGLEQDPFTDF